MATIEVKILSGLTDLAGNSLAAGSGATFVTWDTATPTEASFTEVKKCVKQLKILEKQSFS
jgi:hypothetical protein